MFKLTETNKARQVNSKVNSMLIIFFDIKGIFHEEFVLAGHTVNSICYCDVLWQQKIWLLHHNSTPSCTSFSTREFLTRNNMTVIPHPPCFSLFPQLKIKLKGRHFDTIEVIEAESQAVLNILTERNFQDAFKKNGRSAGNGAYVQKGLL
jgi:hypothetical protein